MIADVMASDRENFARRSVAFRIQGVSITPRKNATQCTSVPDFSRSVHRLRASTPDPFRRVAWEQNRARARKLTCQPGSPRRIDLLTWIVFLWRSGNPLFLESVR